MEPGGQLNDVEVNVDELSALVSQELDKLVGNKFDKFDKSLKDFGDSINNFHKVLMQTRKDTEKMLEDENRKREEAQINNGMMELHSYEHDEGKGSIDNNYNDTHGRVNNINNNRHHYTTTPTIKGYTDSNKDNNNRPNNKLGASKSEPILTPISKMDSKHYSPSPYKNHIRRRNSPRNLKPISLAHGTCD